MPALIFVSLFWAGISLIPLAIMPKFLATVSLILISLSANGQKAVIISDYNTRLEWDYIHRYSLLDSLEYYRRSYSVASIQEIEKQWPLLNSCDCTIQEDSLTIRINQTLNEGGLALVISMSGADYKVRLLDYDCIPTDRYYPVVFSSLIINSPKYKIGDRLHGSLNCTTATIESMSNKTFSFNGSFQCIIH